jgi:beta-glucanase (GH16 family)
MPKTSARRWLWSVAVAIIAAAGLTVAASSDEASDEADARTLTLAPIADTYVQADQPDTNFGSSVRWSVEGRPNIVRNALLRFDVAIPAGEEVVSAKIRAYSGADVGLDEYVDIYETVGGWTESGVTWNTAPARGTGLGKSGGFTTGEWVEWDVTRAIGDGGSVNFQLETNSQRWVGFKSSESSDESLHPQLVVTTQAATTPPPPTDDETTAAATHNWGNVVAGDEFDYAGPADPAKWSVYDSPGHDGQGLRRPSQVTVDGNRLVINGTADGTTGGMSATFANQKYGRWETRMALPSGDNEYHGVAILWPDSGNWPCDGEIDYAENRGDRSVMRFFHHYNCENQQTSASKAVDATAFHNYAVDWSPAGITGYIDGVQWFQDDDPAHQPPGSMHQTLQLDWFPDSTADGTGQMLVDWVRVYAAAG